MNCYNTTSLLLLAAIFLPSLAFITPNVNIAIIGKQKQKLHSTLAVTTKNHDDNNNSNDDVDSNQRSIEQLKQSLIDLSHITKRGFYASSKQHSKVKEIINHLTLLNPTIEPASAYYDNNNSQSSNEGIASIEGKWTLLYTNAPDITSLDPNTSIFPIKLPSSAKLGRIGQECDILKSTISNVIEWKRPDWVDNVLLSKSITPSNDDNNDDIDDGGRILQKVVCEAKAFPKEPNIVQLNLVGFELLGETSTSDNNNTKPRSISPKDILMKGPAELLKRRPIQLRGPLKAPFGRFEILFLDDQMRIIKTGQGYLAVNIREEEAWF